MTIDEAEAKVAGICGCRRERVMITYLLDGSLGVWVDEFLLSSGTLRTIADVLDELVASEAIK